MANFGIKSALKCSLFDKFIFVLLFMLPSLAQGSGNYTSQGSRALADTNMAGDELLAGDRKILLRREQFENALFLKKTFPGEPSVVTGALLQRENEQFFSTTQAIVCAETEAHFLSINERGLNKTSSIQLKDALKLELARDLRCAVNPANGEWLAVNINSGIILINGKEVHALGKSLTNWTHVVFLNDSFFVLGANGAASRINKISQSDNRYFIQRVKAPWPDLQNRDSLSAQGSTLIRSGESQTAIINLQSDSSQIQWSEPVRIGINPCSETAGCGVWIGKDGRWIVGGSWGIYIGKGENFSRLQAPLLISDATSPGIAINLKLQKFIVVGDIDSDIRNLPPEASLARFQFTEKFKFQKESRGKQNKRYLVWLKGLKKNRTSTPERTFENSEPLFTYNPHTNANFRSGDVVIYRGRLPQYWPQSWAAVEEELEFNELTLANEWVPNSSIPEVTPPKTPWWVQAVNFKSVLAWINANGINISPLRVAVIDSGIDLNHPALKDVLDINAEEIPENGLDDDHNGLVDDVMGYDFVFEQAQPMDYFGHGTHVAGLINNAWSKQALMGGAFNTKLRIFRALDQQGKSNSIDLARAISATIRSKADLMNCSWGGGPETQALRDAFAAAKASNILIFTSAGNDGLKTDNRAPVPKNFPGVLPIGAFTAKGDRARFSNWGEKSVFAFAPGADITSTLPASKIGEKSGTSMASPIAAAAGALILGAVRAKYPEWSQEQQNRTSMDLLCSAANSMKPSQKASRCGSIDVFKSFERLERGEL